MNSLLRNISSIILLLSITAPFAGAWIWLSSKQEDLKKEVRAAMAEGFEADQLTTLSFSKWDAESLLDWKDGHEFEFKGRMYDVVRSGTKADSVFYVCYADEGETQLKAERRKMVALLLGQNPHQKHQQEFISQFVKTLVPVSIENWKAVSNTGISISDNFLTFVPPGRENAPPVPPPEMIG